MRKGQKVEDEYLKAALWEGRPEAWHEIVKGVKRRILTHSPVGMMVLYRIETKSVVVRTRTRTPSSESSSKEEAISRWAIPCGR